jgi:hypothetical protein
MADEFKPGDKVTWNYAGNTVEGEVKEKITEETEAAGRKVKASEENPQYRVESDKNGSDAVHKPESLDKA